MSDKKEDQAKIIFANTYLGVVISFWRSVTKRKSNDAILQHTSEKMLELLENDNFEIKQLAYFLTPIDIQKNALSAATQAAGGVNPFKKPDQSDSK